MTNTWEQERKAKGLCVKCNTPIAEGNAQYCEYHVMQRRALTSKYYNGHTTISNYRSKISGHRSRIKIMQILGGLVCAWCGQRDYRLLTIDHIQGHDTPLKERAKARNSIPFVDIEKIQQGDTSNYRVLCYNCQARNEHVRGTRTIKPEIREAILVAGGAIGEGSNGIT